MYRLRFETISQLFDVPPDAEVVIPAEEIAKHIDSEPALRQLASEGKLIAEIPSVLWENSVERIKSLLSELGSFGIKDALCENIGAINICDELGFAIRGGAYLNVLNSMSVKEYAELGAKDLTASFEMPFGKQRKFLSALKKAGLNVPVGIIVYGFLPLMKFRACPAMGKDGCRGCSRDKYLTDRMGEKFRILCHDSRYSELLNCVPLYAADKQLPPFDFYTLYFTVEEKEECRRIFDMVRNGKTPGFRRTAGLYNRELL